MANKTFEDLAKELGYRNFSDMKNSVGKKKPISSYFKKEKDSKSPTKAGEQTEGSISADVVPFLNIIAKNSLALPGMARDMNVLRQNIVKLVKLKNAEAITKADKFFKTEDQREAELEAARKQETTSKPEREGKTKKEKMEKGGEEQGVLGVLWDAIKGILGGLFIGLGLAFAKVFDLGKIVSSIVDKLNPMPLIEGLFKTLKEGWKQITETDIVKETLIKGFGKFLDFITAGLFGEKELRESLDDLKTYLTPMMDVLGATFDKVVAWLKDNVGWDSFTIPLSKATNLIPDEIKKYLPAISLPDITVPGFRPFKNAGKKKEQPSGGGGAGGAAPPTPATDATTAAAATATTPEAMMPVSEKTSDLGMPAFPATGDKTKDSAIQDFFGGGKASLGSGDPSAMFANMLALKEKYKDVSGAGASTGTGATVRDPSDNFKSVPPTPSRATEPPPVAAPTPAPAPTAPATTVEELQAQIEKQKRLKKTFKDNSDKFIKRLKDPNSRNYNPEKAKEIEEEAKETEKSYDDEIAAMEKELANLKKGNKGSSPSSSGSTPPTISASAGSAGGAPSMGGMSGGGAAPTAAAASPTTSGASISSASSEVAEGQRMDSAASAGVYVDAGTVNSGSTTTGKQPKQTASAYNSDFIKSYAT